jgi:hypothetical protein
VPAPALNSPVVPSVDPSSTPSDDSDSDSGSEGGFDDFNDPNFAPDSASGSPAPLPRPDFPLSPSASPEPSSSGSSDSSESSPEPEPNASSPAPPSDARDSRTPPAPGAPYVTCSGHSSCPAGEWWKVDHPYQHARERCRAQRSGSSPESAAEAAITALEDANSVRMLTDAELIEYAFLTCMGAEPRSYKEAMKSDAAGLWHDASQQEYDALNQHDVWELCELPPGRKAVGCCWVYRVKMNADGTVDRYKAWLVAQGFSQKPHLDYTETFAPVAKFAFLQTVLALAAAEDMEVHTMDVSSMVT